MAEETVSGVVNLSVVDELVDRYGTATDAAIPILLGLQERYGYLSMEVLRYVTEKTESTPGQIYGVATFYGQFRMKPVGEHMVRVCHQGRGVSSIPQHLRQQIVRRRKRLPGAVGEGDLTRPPGGAHGQSRQAVGVGVLE